MKTYTCDIHEDPETGEAIIQFPPELVAQLGWREGDVLVYSIEPGRVLVTQKRNFLSDLRTACMQLITRVRARKNGTASN